MQPITNNYTKSFFIVLSTWKNLEQQQVLRREVTWFRIIEKCIHDFSGSRNFHASQYLQITERNQVLLFEKPAHSVCSASPAQSLFLFFLFCGLFSQECVFVKELRRQEAGESFHHLLSVMKEPFREVTSTADRWRKTVYSDILHRVFQPKGVSFLVISKNKS